MIELEVWGWEREGGDDVEVGEGEGVVVCGACVEKTTVSQVSVESAEPRVDARIPL